MNASRPYSMATRSARAELTRQRIVDAAGDLFFARPFAEVTLADIAEAAAVSHQTVLNHFESKAGVVAGVAAAAKEQSLAARSAEPGDIAGAVHALVQEYERMGDANVRWAIEDLEEIRPYLDEARQMHRDWLAALFGADLPTAAPARQRAIDALHVATDVYTWKLLRRDLRRSQGDTESTMAGLVAGVLQGATP